VKRGDIVSVAVRGAYSGKPRPAVVVQSDLFNDTHASVTLCLLTSEVHDAPLFRIRLEPRPGNGLRVTSQAMVDKMLSAPRSSLGPPIGALDDRDMAQIDGALRLWLAL
jgi:mRNA interferase MazF